MTRIDWPTVSSSDVELVAAVLIHREHPRAQRIRPSRGDQGIDILDPIDASTEDIYQVKSFTGTLTSARKRQISSSLDRVAKARGDRIRDWYLVLPMDRTVEMDEWFNELVADRRFRCTWLGQTYLDGLAAKYPEVADYYLWGGKAKLESKLSDLNTLLGLKAATEPSRSIRPSDVRELMSSVAESIDAADPHFRYELQFAGHPPSRQELLGKQGAVATSTAWDGTRASTITIYLKYDAALEDRPIPINLTIEALPGSPLAEQLERFADYGTGLDLPPGAIRDLRIDLPGGLGGDLSGAGGRIEPAVRPSARPYFLKLEVLGPDLADVGEVTLQMEPSTAGMRGGHAIEGRSLSGVVGFRAWIKPVDATGGTLTINLRVLDLFDRPVRTVIGGLRFLRQLQPGNSLVITSLDGRRLGSPMPIPEALATGEEFDELLNLCEDLLTLQEQVSWDIPLQESLPQELDSAIRRAARLLRGDRVVERWNEMTAQIFKEGIDEVKDLLAKPSALLVESDWTLTLPAGVVPLGRVAQRLHSAMLQQEPLWDDSDQTFHCIITPATSDLMETTIQGRDPSTTDEGSTDDVS